MNRKNLGARLGLYPTPVVVVGTYDKDDKPNLITLAWAGICCSEPPCLQISVRKERHSWSAITERGAFSVNVPSKKYVVETDYIGIASGRSADKFAATGLTPVKGELVDAPLVAEFPVSMECKLKHSIEVGSHDLFVGEIVACWIDEDAPKEGTKVRAEKIDPLLYMPGGEYFGIGEFIAGGYTLGKKLIEK
ncbi:flavodoxin [Synergistales bacterium]|nr:flavodoxin [Synergistales bacterium]